MVRSGNLLLDGGSLADNHVLTLRAGTDVADRDTDELLDELDVGASLLGEIILYAVSVFDTYKEGNSETYVALAVSDGLVPAGELLVDNLKAIEDAEIGREVLDLLTSLGVLVGNGNLDGLEGVEDIELGEVKGSVVVDGSRVLEDNKIEPAATTLATGADTPLATNLLELGTGLLEVLGLEGTTTDTGGLLAWNHRLANLAMTSYLESIQRMEDGKYSRRP